MKVCNKGSKSKNKCATKTGINNKQTPMGLRLDGRDLMMLDKLKARFGVTTTSRASTIRMCIQKQYEIAYEKSWADLIEDKTFMKECAKYGYKIITGKI